MHELHFKNCNLVPGMVRNLQQRIFNNGKFEYIELNWDEPFAKGSDTITYLVKYGGSTWPTTYKRYTIDDITEIDKIEVRTQEKIFKSQARKMAIFRGVQP